MEPAVKEDQRNREDREPDMSLQPQLHISDRPEPPLFPDPQPGRKEEDQKGDDAKDQPKRLGSHGIPGRGTIQQKLRERNSEKRDVAIGTLTARIEGGANERNPSNNERPRRVGAIEFHGRIVGSDTNSRMTDGGVATRHPPAKLEVTELSFPFRGLSSPSPSAAGGWPPEPLRRGGAPGG